MRLGLRLGMAAAVVAFCAGIGASAHAQAAPDDVNRARALFEQGVDAARRDRWAEALTAFSQSYDLAPRPATLLNLAGAQAHTNRLVEAARNYRQFLATATSREAMPYRTQAQSALDAVLERVGQVEIVLTGTTATDRVYIDAEEVLPESLSNGPLPVEPGSHHVIVQRNGQQVANEPFTVAAGATARAAVTITATLPPVITDPRCDANNPNRVSDCPEIYGRRGGSIASSPFFWVAIGVAVVAVVVVVVLVSNSGETEEPYSGNLNPGTITF